MEFPRIRYRDFEGKETTMIPKEFSVEGKAAIVTGAGRGIGRAIATTLAEAGADVAVISRTGAQIEETARMIEKLGRKALPVQLDVSKEEQVGKGVERVLSAFGRVDILCSNAGIFLTRPVAISPDDRIPGADLAGNDANKPIRLEEWRKVLDTNLTAALLFARAVGPHMMKQRKGKVVITSSTAGDEGQNFLSAYCVSKAGLNSLTRCLASEWGQFNITVNAIAPGMIRTDMIKPFEADPAIIDHSISLVPLGRLGEPREVALLALFLASEASSYISGQVFTIDGGARGRGTGI
jgi:NAD(P)-dependent dehydrogenase (short-subunit alcohol dehydrogenase family)